MIMASRSEPSEMQLERWALSNMIGLYAWESAGIDPLLTDSMQLGALIGGTPASGPYMAFDNIAIDRESPEGRPEIHQLASIPCSLCPKIFVARKSLYRHIRSKHSSSHSLRFHCFHCGRRFARQDIVNRHMRTQHAGLDEMQQCEFCLTYVRPRSLKQHIKSSKCQRTRLQAPSSQVIRQASMSVEDVFPLQTPSYLAAIAEPMVLAAWMFVKYQPWGAGHRWLVPHTQPPASAFVSVEVLELTGLVYRKIMEALEDPNANRDWALTDAITTLMLFICMTEGWNAARPHVQGMVRLTAVQLEVSGGSAEEWVMNTTTAEAFDTALSRDVAGPAVSACADIFAQAIKLMHRGAVDIIQAPRTLSEQNVWTRVQYLEGADWLNHYEHELRPIAALASSIPRGESRCKSSPHRTRQVCQGLRQGAVARTQRA